MQTTISTGPLQNPLCLHYNISPIYVSRATFLRAYPSHTFVVHVPFFLLFLTKSHAIIYRVQWLLMADITFSQFTGTENK